jgi:hypothetical protein
MNVMRKVLPYMAAAPTAEVAAGEVRAPVLHARSPARRPTLEEIMADTEKRFPKTLAYLAK